MSPWISVLLLSIWIFPGSVAKADPRGRLKHFSDCPQHFTDLVRISAPDVASVSTAPRVLNFPPGQSSPLNFQIIGGEPLSREQIERLIKNFRKLNKQGLPLKFQLHGGSSLQTLGRTLKNYLDPENQDIGVSILAFSDTRAKFVEAELKQRIAGLQNQRLIARYNDSFDLDIAGPLDHIEYEVELHYYPATKNPQMPGWHEDMALTITHPIMGPNTLIKDLPEDVGARNTVVIDQTTTHTAPVTTKERIVIVIFGKLFWQD